MTNIENWKTELRHAYRDRSSVVTERYPALFSQRLLTMMEQEENQDGPLNRQFRPQNEEINLTEGLLDPIGDEAHWVAPQLIHRYHSRALFLPTTICPVNCRYCFRKNELQQESEMFVANFEQTLSYLHSHNEIEELIFTGGDPFILDDSRLDFYLAELTQVSHLKWLRFHTRVPTALPERLTEKLKQTLLKYTDHFHGMTLVAHTNHVAEWDEVAVKAIKNFRHADLPWLSQSVLLRGVNDNTQALADLCKKLIQLKIRPYYLHHPDPVKGANHFTLTLEEGRAIYAPLRDLLPGWALPQYIIDIPGGHGKVNAFNPEGLSFSGQLLDLKGNLRPLC